MAITRHLDIAAKLLKEPDVPPSDRLPYSPEFDTFQARFAQLIGRETTSREVWEAIVGARKRGLVGASRRRRRSFQLQSHHPSDAENS
jgi:hypothetical protein